MAARMERQDPATSPDRFQLFFGKMRELYDMHRARFYAGGGALLLVALLAGGWLLYAASYEKSAGKLYGAVLEAAQKAGSPAGDEAAISGFKELIARYPRSKVALLSQYRLGNLHLQRREYDAAIGAYQEFLKRGSDEGGLITLAHGGVGISYEAKNEPDKALESFEKAIQTPAASSFEALNFGNIARIHESRNDAAKAAEYYRKALEKTTDPIMTLFLKRKIAMLG